MVLLTFDESSSVLLIFFNQSVQSDEAWKNLKKNKKNAVIIAEKVGQKKLSRKITKKKFGC
jgi:hypothetical protein